MNCGGELWLTGSLGLIHIYPRTLNFNVIFFRYATAQNLKAARLVIYLAPYKCICSMLVLAFYILVFDSCPDKWLPISTELYYVYLYLQVS